MFWLKSVIFRLVKISGLFWLNSVVFNNSNGWLEFSKRLACFGMSFKWPSNAEEAMSVTMADIEEMLRGGNPWRRFPQF